MAAAPVIATTAGPPNAVVQVQPGMQVQPVVLVDKNGNYITAPSSVMTTAGDMLYENATPAPARLPAGSAGQVLGVSGGLPAWGMGMTLLATTGLTGYTLVNNTGTIISWTAPNDGAMHRVMFIYVFVVTSNETGGQITYTATSAGNTLISNSNLITAAQTSGTYKFNPNGLLVYPNTAVTISQFTALTGGAAMFWGEIWGS